MIFRLRRRSAAVMRAVSSPIFKQLTTICPGEVAKKESQSISFHAPKRIGTDLIGHARFPFLLCHAMPRKHPSVQVFNRQVFNYPLSSFARNDLVVLPLANPAQRIVFAKRIAAIPIPRKNPAQIGMADENDAEH